MKKRALFAALAAFGFTHAALAAEPPRTGDQRRSYFFADAKKTMPYRLYVPTNYDSSRAYPLIVVLHGGGSDENRPFDTSALREEAEKRGVIVVSPLGLNTFGGYGEIYPVIVTKDVAAVAPQLLKRSGAGDAANLPPPPSSAHRQPATKDDAEEVIASMLVEPTTGVLSEKDVMNVIALVEKEYRVDPARIYLMGNSMGGLGTQYLGAKYAEKFAALAPSGGPVAEWSYPFHRLRDHNIAVLYVHGDRDEHSNAHWSQVLAERARKNGVEAEFLLVKNGSHVQAWTMVLPETFDFLLRHKKTR